MERSGGGGARPARVERGAGRLAYREVWNATDVLLVPRPMGVEEFLLLAKLHGILVVPCFVYFPEAGPYRDGRRRPRWPVRPRRTQQRLRALVAATPALPEPERRRTSAPQPAGRR